MQGMTNGLRRRDFIKGAGLFAIGGLIGPRMVFAGESAMPEASKQDATRKLPNILLLIADDWGWPSAGVYGDKVVKTPAFDRIAAEGVAFTNAYVSAPSCCPSRAALMTGQHFWRLAGCTANYEGQLSRQFPIFPALLETAGFDIMYTGKVVGPMGKSKGDPSDEWKFGDSKPAKGHLPQKKDVSEPFCHLSGSSDPHRPYTAGSGLKSGKRLEDVVVPSIFPDVPEVRSDILDYYFAIERFDSMVAREINDLERKGKLDNTIVIVTGDNGMPFPRCKGQLYDYGTRVPLAIRWPERIKKGRIVDDLVSWTDIAPTILDAAGLVPPAEMTGRSLMNVLTSTKSGLVDPSRDRVFTGLNHHERKDGPMRAVRTREFLYIRNLKPGNSVWGGDGSPTREYMRSHFDLKCSKLAFGARPAEELYEVVKDPLQIANLAEIAEFDKIRGNLAGILTDELRRTKDPLLT